MASSTGRKRPLPGKAEILRYIEEAPGRVGRREIARAFGLKGSDRTWLRGVLAELADEGRLVRGRRRRLAPVGRLPAVGVIEICEIDTDGELHARPVSWRRPDAPPEILVAPPRPGMPALGLGDRILARLEREGPGRYTARAMRHIQAAPDRVLGVYSRVGPDGRIQPTDRRLKFELAVAGADSAGARSGDVVVAEILPGRGLGLKRGRVIERLGGLDDPRSLSLIAIHGHGLPTRFSDAALAEAAAARPVRLGRRTDLRDLPLVTIDPADARDYDDAVWAAPDDDPGNPGGWRVVVAISDLAHYVRPGTALDRDALARGTSVYFPDRVVPMLPEALSTELCSLKPNVQRPCLAVEMRFDAAGNKRGHRFVRGLMRSVARLTYAQVQAAYDGNPDAATAPLLDDVIKPLYGAYRALAAARDRRQPLAIEIPERRVELGPDGFIAAIRRRARLDSHRLIEEFMIAANVCAAETCEAVGQPCMYRVHEEPAPDKLEALRDFLDSLGLRLAKGQVVRPALFNGILARVAGTPEAELVNEVILRTQAQAFYGPVNSGHFGLALRRYAHFTSPIRRYADLLVHRALIRGLRLGPGGLPDDAEAEFAALGEQISSAERRAVSAERDALDRFTAAYMADRVGAVLTGRISGVTRFGLFVKLDESGADGLVPMRTLADDFYDHDARAHALVGRRFGRRYRLGDRVEVRLAEAAPVTGGLRFELLGEGGPARRQNHPARSPRKRTSQSSKARRK